jgi:hypothetical protein
LGRQWVCLAHFISGVNDLKNVFLRSDCQIVKLRINKLHTEYEQSPENAENQKRHPWHISPDDPFFNLK